MISDSSTGIWDINDKALFIEQVGIYTRLVEAYVERNNLDLNKWEERNDLIIAELKEIGIKNEVCVELKGILDNDLYIRFISAVHFTINNKDSMEGLLDKLYESKRKEINEEAQNASAPKLVDFFCGAGGLSLGFIQEGFSVRLANDIEDVCINTYRLNHPELPNDKLIKGDIKNIVDNIEDYIDVDMDIVVGGPPCQGFSEANRQRVIDDPRNKLYKYYLKAVEKIAPKYVVMENVKGMLKVADQVVEDYCKLRIDKNGTIYTYDISYQVLNSYDFSVAQSRERLIYIAVRNDIQDKYGIKSQDIFNEIRRNNENSKKFILMDALSDIKPLDAPKIKNMNEVDDEKTGKKIDVNWNAENNNKYLKMINQGRNIPFLFNHKARYVSNVNYEIYSRLGQGEDATSPQIADIMPYAHRNHCFKDKYYKLIADRPSRTITAHLRMDCHSHIHPFQVRSITPREAARIQSFPDDYLFMGAYLKTYMQIGNAVPPLMARGIANVIKKYL